jgi:uncharacterized protein
MNSLIGADAPTTTTPASTIASIPRRAWSWNREPSSWDASGPGLTWRCRGVSDFWRKTEGVPPAHDGCSLLTRVEADFEFELLVTGTFTGLYDQVGLMVVASELRWLKAGVEIDTDLWLSAVHTREESDWSRERWDEPSVRLRADRRNGTIELSVMTAGVWRVFRTLHLPGSVGIGPYSCSPKGDGFEASASQLKLIG